MVKSAQGNKGIILELVGPPGAGKTTICDMTKKSLVKDGLIVSEFKDFKKYFYKKSKVKLIFHLIGYVLKNSGVYWSYIITLIRGGVINLNSFFRYFKISLFQSVIDEYLKVHNVDVLLLDQWSVQQLWSATIFRAKKYDFLSRNLNRYYFEPDILIYMDVNKEVAKERIVNRASMTSRFDKMSKEESGDNMDRYTSYLGNLYKSSKCNSKLMISGLDEPESNVLKLVNQINLIFGA